MRHADKSEETRIADWFWVTTLSPAQANTERVVRLGHRRWTIENQGFNELVLRNRCGGSGALDRVGLLDLQVTNLGVIGNVWIDEPSAAWRDGQYLYLAGLWLGAIASDNLPYVSTGIYEIELRPSLDPIDHMYPSYEGIPNGNRIGFSEQADDDGDGLVDEDFHNGKDDDGDGAIDEDFCAISEQMYSCEYWDYTEEAMQAYPEHRPLNLKIRQRSMAWSSGGIDEFVGFDLTISNDGFEVLRHVYLGLFVDGDVGPLDPPPNWYLDDGGAVASLDTMVVDPTITGCDSLPLSIEMTYMYDIPDNGNDVNGGDVEGFFGLLFLGHTTDPTGRHAPADAQVRTARFFTGSGAYPSGDPRNDFERYDALSSGVVVDHPTGPPEDYRHLVSVGPFPELLPGESIDLQFAFVVGEGYYDPVTNTPHPGLGTDGLPCEHSLLANAIRARLVYEGRWKDLDGSPLTGVEGRETCISTPPGEPFVWVNPCDSTDVRVFEGTSCDDPESWVDNDCDLCTPNPYHEGCGEGGCESLVHWYTPPAIAAVGPDGDGALAQAAGIVVTPLATPAFPPMEFLIGLGTPAVCDVRIYDIAGRLVRSLGRKNLPAGVHRRAWNGRTDQGSEAGSGLYFVQVRGGSTTIAGRFVLLRR